MDYVIRVDYTSNDNKVMQRGTFPIKRRTSEQAAYDFWRQIKREMPFECYLEKVVVDAEDITEKVMELDKK